MSPDANLAFALVPDVGTREQLAARAALLRSQHPMPRPRWLDPACYRLTLVRPMPGRCGIDTIARAADPVRGAAFELLLDQAASSVDGERLPWWLSSRRPPEALRELPRLLAERLREAGVTLLPARSAPQLMLIADAGRSLAPRAIPPLAWPVSEFCLVRCEGEAGAAGEILGHWKLSAERARDHEPQRNLWDT